MTLAAGLALALASAFALNWGWVAQHGAARSLPPLSLRHPLGSLGSLFGDRGWVVGFAVGLGGWAFYVAALTLAPLSLVQATSAGGVGLLAALAHRRGDAVDRADWSAVVAATAGLVLIGVSLAGGTSAASRPHPFVVAAWLAVSGLAFVARGGVAAGTLYAAGDVATKAAVFGGPWLVLVPVVLAAHGLAFVALQLGFQRGGALETAGTASLLTNALPIAAGVVVFHEHLPGGALGGLRALGFVLVVAAAAVLARSREAHDTIGDVVNVAPPEPEERLLVWPAGEPEQAHR
jgi:hypothetical protein